MNVEKELADLTFNPGLTFGSGQAFRWRPIADAQSEWIGIVSGTIVKVARNSATMIGTNQRGLDFDSLLE